MIVAVPKHLSADDSFPVNKPFICGLLLAWSKIYFFTQAVMYNYIADIKHEQIPSERNEFGPVLVIPFPC